MRNAYDIIIIGSGAGGGTVASRLAPLAEAGAKIAVLEAGPYYPEDYLTQREIEMMDIFKDRGAWPTADGSITMSMGSAVGGSTLMYTGVTFRLPEKVCYEWNVAGLTPDDLQQRFDRLEKEIHVVEPDESMENDNNRLFKEGCEKLGIPVEKIKLNIEGCEQMGFCNLGCAKGNKQGTLKVQLPEAKKAGVEIIPNCTVDRIEKQKVFARIRNAPPGTLEGSIPPGPVELRAKVVVVAAGTAGSPAILKRSGFDKDFPALGKYITLHPALTVYGIYPEKITNYKGFPKIYYTPAFSESHDHYIETAFYYPFITTKNLGLWGKDLKSVMKRYNQLMSVIILVHDAAKAENCMELEKDGQPKLHYELSEETIKAFCHAQQQATQIFFSAGCKEVVMPGAKMPLFNQRDMNSDLESFISPKHFLLNKVPVASAHLQGGCRMGSDPENSVTDSWGQVHGHPWLFVADGSLFPKSSHVNPYLTIMALADRVGERITEMQTDWENER